MPNVPYRSRMEPTTIRRLGGITMDLQVLAAFEIAKQRQQELFRAADDYRLVREAAKAQVRQRRRPPRGRRRVWWRWAGFGGPKLSHPAGTLVACGPAGAE